MVLRFRRRRTGPGPAGTALALLALVLAVAYLYYETPLIQAGGAWPRLPGPPQPAWSADLPAAWAGEPGELLLSVGDRHILTARAAAGMVEAVWYDRFGYAAAQSPQLPVDGAPGGPLAASGLLVLAGEPDVPLLRVLSPASPPGGMTWRPPVPAAGIRPVAVHQALLAAAVFGAPQGPDLAPDLLAVLDIGGSEPALRWSQPYQERRLLQGAGGPAGLAVTTVDPESGSFHLELWSWQGERLWSSDSSAGPLRLLAVGPSGHDAGEGSDPGSVPARAWVADGVALTSVGPGGAGPALTDGRPPQRCWPVGQGAACLLLPDPEDAGEGVGSAGGAGQEEGAGPGAELLFIDGGGRISRHRLEPGAVVWPWPGRGALAAAGSVLTAFDAGGARWSLDLPLAPRALAAGGHGLAVSDGHRLAWLRWPAGGGR